MPRSRSRSPHRSHNERRRDRSRDSRDRRRDDDRRRDYDERPERKRRRSRDRDDYRSGYSSRDRSRSRERKKESRRDRSKERRESKSERKRQKEEEQLRQLAELSVYNPVDNPFHDANLNQQFKWHKKAEKDKKSGLSAAEAQARDIARRQEAKEELERLSRRRAEKEAEMALREEEEAKMARLQESAQMAEWIAKEGDFQLEQEKRRSIIRLKERRAKAIDFLSLNLRYVNPKNEEEEDDEDGLDAAGLDIDLDEPYNILDNLNLAQIEELHDDIQKYLSLDENSVHIDFWTNMMIVCKARLSELREQATDGRRGGVIDPGVQSSIEALLNEKSYEQLVELQRSIQAKLSSGDPVDVDYWESLLKNLLVWKAKAKLKSLHEVVVRNRLEQLRKRQRDEALQARVELLGQGKADHRKQWPAEVKPFSSIQQSEEAMEVDEPEPYTRDMSPPLFDPARLSYEDRQLQIIKPIDDLRQLLAQRRTVAATRFVPKTVEQQAVDEPVAEMPTVVDAFTRELNYRMDAEADLDEDDEEELFNGEANLANPVTYTWEDKYRPRKPRYLNRVHTGYEWNKYNQTHYDTDNPPPKVVQGYKFNIFYPDLIDKSKAPTYKIIKEGPNEDTVLLLFTAGPPYEDIAFKIVNRDWEYSHKRGFRSTFDRGCLSLWFNFRRNFYRK